MHINFDFEFLAKLLPIAQGIQTLLILVKFATKATTPLLLDPLLPASIPELPHNRDGIDGKEHFEAVSCAKILGYERPHNAISRHCPHSLKRGVGVETGTKADGTPAIQMVEKTFIPEGDLYRLIARSHLPDAIKFERWVFDEVLPSLRKHGAYLTPEKIEEVLFNPDTIIKIATQLKEERLLRLAAEAQIEQDRPKVEFANQIGDCPGGVGIREFGLVFRQNRAGFGQNGFVSRLLDGKFVYRDERKRLRPYEAFDIVSHIVRHPASTFFMKVAGDSLTGAGIFDGDLIVVDRSLEAKSGDIVVAILDGEFTIKRFRRNGSSIELVPENPKYRKITLNEGMEMEIWGVVTGTYKSFK